MKWLGLCAGLVGCATVVPGTYPGDTAIWNSLVAAPETLVLPGRPIAAIAPHHLIDGFEMAAFWKALAAAAPASVVVVIGPDHHYAGAGPMTIGRDLRYPTPFGTLTPDAPLVGRLLASTAAKTHDPAFAGEHSIHAHAPFIARYFPGARFVPVIVQWGSDPATLEQLAVALNESLPPDALLVASVDFSHFQGEPWATFHDQSAWSTIAAFDTDALFEREVDSPESLYIAMRFAALRGAKRATRVLHTNSQTKRTVFVPDSTSHQYVTFTRGEPAPSPTVNVLITGEVAAATGLKFRDSWRWHSFVPEDVPREPRLAQIRGQEDRFFMGADAFVFRLEPGERIERTLNGIRVVFAGVSLADAVDVKALKGSADCLVVLAWRANQPVEAARALADAGADVVVGRGFGPSLPLEDRNGHLLALSLGDFLPEALTASEGNALGVTWTPEGLRIRTVPLTLVQGIPHVDLERLADALSRNTR